MTQGVALHRVSHASTLVTTHWNARIDSYPIPAFPWVAFMRQIKKMAKITIFTGNILALTFFTSLNIVPSRIFLMYGMMLHVLLPFRPIASVSGC